MTVATITVPGYRLNRMIGRGGFGIVWHATRESDGHDVAVKVLHRLLDPDASDRFNDEIQTMGTLSWHPNIVQIIDAGSTSPNGDPSHQFIAMEFLPGGSLGQRLTTFGPAPVPDVIAAGVQAATGLQVAHNAGVLHRDVKPDNLLVGAQGQVKVSDFGIAVASSGAAGVRGATGTLAYSAPELLGGQAATPASDVYALGATLFALLTGESAFHRATDESPAAMILRAYTQPVPDLGASGVPDPLARVIQRAMARQPEDRPESAEALGVELTGAAAALGLPTPDVVGAGQRRNPGTAPAFRPSTEDRQRAQRLGKLTRRVGAVAMALIAVAFISVTSFTGQDADLEAESGVAGDAAVPTITASPVPAADEALPDSADDAESYVEEQPALEDPVALPSATATPAPTTASDPDPAPALPPIGGTDPPFGTLAPPRLVASDGDRRYIHDGQTLYSYAESDGQSAVDVDLPGVRDLVVIDAGVAVLGSDGSITIFSPLLDRLATPAVEAAAIVSDAGSLVAGTSQGVVRIAVTGQVSPLSTSNSLLLAAGNDTLWSVTPGNVVERIDLASGETVARAILPSIIRDAAVVLDGSLLIATDEGVERVSPDGTVAQLTPLLANAVVVDSQGSIFVLTAGQVIEVDRAGEGTPLALESPVSAIGTGPTTGLLVGTLQPPAAVAPGG